MATVDICIPSYNFRLEPETHNTLIQMIRASACMCGTHPTWKCPKGKHSIYNLPFVGGGIIHWSRNASIAASLYGRDPNPERPPAEYLMLIDDDMAMEPGYLNRLLSHKVDIVVGICTKRADPPHPVIMHWKPEKKRFEFPQEWDRDAQKLIEIDAAGAAFMLVKRKVFDVMADAYLTCWFERQEEKRRYGLEGLAFEKLSSDGLVGSSVLLNQAIESYWDRKAAHRKKHFEKMREKGDTAAMSCWWFQFLGDLFEEQITEFGEDFGFCWKAKKLGFRIFADPQVAPGHIGAYAYNLLDYWAYVDQQKENGVVAGSEVNVPGLTAENNAIQDHADRGNGPEAHAECS